MEKILSLTLKPNLLPFFSSLFQQGVLIKVTVGTNLKDLLSLHLGLSPAYVQDRIQTIFLDGKAVDDLGKAVIGDGSTLALSAAMPGLVGATLRRGGVFASLRSSITHQADDPSTLPTKEGWIILKLFNLLVPELGPFLLAKGVWIKGESFIPFLKGLTKDFWKGCLEVIKNGRKIEVLSPGWIEDWYQKDDIIHLKVFSTPAPVTPYPPA